MKSMLSRSLDGLRNSWFAALMLAPVIGCAGTDEFLYKYYGLDAASYNGRLLASKAKNDLPLSMCAPDEHVKGKCVVMFVEEFELFRLDYMRCKETLKDKQKE